jgi:hypothetical protein
MPYPEKPQGHGADAPQSGVFQTRVARQITDKISEVVSVATTERVVEAANEGVAAQSPLDGGLAQLPQCSFAFRVRDAHRRQCATGAPHGSKCKSIYARRPCLPLMCAGTDLLWDHLQTGTMRGRRHDRGVPQSTPPERPAWWGPDWRQVPVACRLSIVVSALVTGLAARLLLGHVAPEQFGEAANHGGTGLSTGGYRCALAGGLGSWPALYLWTRTMRRRGLPEWDRR